MHITDIEKGLPVFEALASPVRLKLLKLIADYPRNISNLAMHLGISSAAVTAHVDKLAEAGLIATASVPGKRGLQKLCTLTDESFRVTIDSTALTRTYHRVSMPIGHYVDWSIKPTCGLAGQNGLVGFLDDPSSFADPSRMNAGMLWFASGFIEYRFPNRLLSSQQPQVVEFHMEISSEAPGTNSEWPSDIFFYVNHKKLGMWTSPGEFYNRRGINVPDWFPGSLSQCGQMKVLTIDETGTSIDGTRISNITINDLELTNGSDIVLKIESPSDCTHPGGVTLFGHGFGNYGHDLEMRLFFMQKEIYTSVE